MRVNITTIYIWYLLPKVRSLDRVSVLSSLDSLIERISSNLISIFSDESFMRVICHLQFGSDLKNSIYCTVLSVTLAIWS